MQSKRKSKGHEDITIDEQQSIFSIRNRMIEIYENFPNMNNKEICQCGSEENMKHIYICEYLCENKEMKNPKFEQIYEENIRDQRIISKIFNKIIKTEKQENKKHNLLRS